MDATEKTLELLEKIEKNSRRQVLYGRLQFIFAFAAALCCFILLVCSIKVLPRLQETAAQAETVLQNLEAVTSQLAQCDLSGMVSNMDALVTTSQEGIDQAMEKLNGIDFDALNKAIKDLSDVIEPIANFFKTFRIG